MGIRGYLAFTLMRVLLLMVGHWAVFRAEDRGIDTTIDPDLNHFFDNLTQFLMDLSSEQSVKLQG
jgi:hypothetical protein